MKKVNILVVFLAVAAFCGCSREEVKQVAELTNGTMTLKAIAPATKTAFSDKGEGTWLSSDEISVYATDGNFHTYTLKSGAGSSEAEFTGDEITTSSVAVSPAGSPSLSGTALTINLPSEYEWSSEGNSNIPMVAVISEEGSTELSFKHVGALLKVSFSNVPATATKFVVSVDENNIAGDFAISDYTADAAEITTASGSNNSVSYTFSAGAASDMNFYVPLPTGSYSNLTIALYDASNNVLFTKSKATALKVTRAQLIIMSAVNLVVVNDVVATADGSNYVANPVYLTQNEAVTVTGLDLSDYYLDPDYLNVDGSSITFNAVSGYYNFEINTEEKYVTIARVDENGDNVDLEHGGLFLMGWGVAHPRMDDGQPGWSDVKNDSYRVAQVSTNVYQFTAIAVGEHDTIMGGRVRYDWVGFKAFTSINWGDAWSDLNWGGIASTYLTQADDKNINLATNLEEGKTYVFTFDFTECTISGTTVTGTPTMTLTAKE